MNLNNFKMKKLTTINQVFAIALLISIMSLNTSCDSCSRKDGSEKGTEDGRDANATGSGSEAPGDNENSGSTDGTGSGAANDTGSNSSASTSGGGTSGTGTTGRKLTEEEITNQVENSNASKAVDKNGNPIQSGGTSGTGQGTGTGSTGNNSKVTSREDQKS